MRIGRDQPPGLPPGGPPPGPPTPNRTPPPGGLGRLFWQAFAAAWNAGVLRSIPANAVRGPLPPAPPPLDVVGGPAPGAPSPLNVGSGTFWPCARRQAVNLTIAWRNCAFCAGVMLPKAPRRYLLQALDAAWKAAVFLLSTRTWKPPPFGPA